MDNVLKIFNGATNVEDIILLADGSPQSSILVNRIILRIGTTIVDSAITPEAFIWPVDLNFDGATPPIIVQGIRLKLGGVGLAPQIYADCRLILYDGVDGGPFVWADNLAIQIFA